MTQIHEEGQGLKALLEAVDNAKVRGLSPLGIHARVSGKGEEERLVGGN